MIVTVFRTRLREDADLAEMDQVGAHMYEIATSMPGFISYKEFAAEDGEYVAIVEFDSLANLAQWKDHPEHVVAQHRGRTEFFNSYRIQVCSIVRAYDFKHDQDYGHTTAGV